MSLVPARLQSRRFFLTRAFTALAGGALLGRARRVEAAPQGAFPDNYLGEIKLWSGTFAPRFWAFCNGQLLPIAQNQALFALLGTTYGGNGQTTFALPNLQGRVPIGAGQGNGLTIRALGEVGGVASHTLLLTELPSHTHVARASSSVGTFDSPPGHVLARNAAQIPQYGSTDDTNLSAGALLATGGGQAHENRQPYLALNYIIALTGIWPGP
jgi:microcystin-dependent protein